MRKITFCPVLAFVLASVFIFTLLFMTTPVWAYNGCMETVGETIVREDGVLLISGIGLTEGAFNEILLYIDEANIYDLRTGYAISQCDIRDGDYVRAVYEPDGRALDVYVHVGATNAADFMVAVSDNIWYSDEGCSFVTADGKYRITLSGDTWLYDSHGYEMSFDEIVPGMEMFIWSSIVTASFPGQVIPDKVVLLGD